MTQPNSKTNRNAPKADEASTARIAALRRLWSERRSQTPASMRAGIEELIDSLEAQALRDNLGRMREQSMQQVFELADVAMVMLDATGRIRLINETASRMLGYRSDELLGQDWFARCLPPDKSEPVRDVFIRLMSGEVLDVERYENEVMTRDGAHLTIAWHNVLLRDADGKPVGTLSSGRDRSKERLTERALSESEEQLRGIFNNTVDAIITINEAGIMQSFNPAAQRMFGYSAQEAIGRNVIMLMPDPYRKEHDEYLERYQATGIARIIGIGREVLGLRKNGTTFPIDLAVSEARLGDRRIFTGILRDISERKRLEREVLDVSTQERERIGRDLHDGLGQELTGIAFLAGVLQRELRSRKRDEADAAGEIVRLVNTAIDHTRALVKGLCPVTLDPDGLMNSLRGLAEMVHEVHRIECAFDCPRPVLIADHHLSTHLYYIAQEAVNNAIKHGKPTQLTLGLYAGKNTCTLRIADDGQGIPPDTARDTGRGMHIMQHRAKAIGAALEVISAPGRGTIISCTFEHQNSPGKATRNHP